MSTLFAMSLDGYVTFYRRWISQRWQNLQPEEYGVLLILIALFGWFLMKNSGK